MVAVGRSNPTYRGKPEYPRINTGHFMKPILCQSDNYLIKMVVACGINVVIFTSLLMSPPVKGQKAPINIPPPLADLGGGVHR